jgi:hypothetical protein
LEHGLPTPPGDKSQGYFQKPVDSGWGRITMRRYRVHVVHKGAVDERDSVMRSGFVPANPYMALRIGRLMEDMA